jgi:hypothetical protein
MNKGSVGEGFSTQETSANPSWQDVACEREYDLLGLALQTADGSIPNDEIDTAEALIETRHQGQMNVCPIQTALFAQLHNVEDNTPKSNQETAQLPMERYLLEGFAERYALVSIDQSGTGGDWAMYSDCRCGHH